MIIFDGKSEAATRKLIIVEEIKELPHLKVFSLVFQEDEPSIIYSRLKKKDAESLGIAYDVHTVPIATPMKEIQALLRAASEDPSVTGIITQRPEKHLHPSAQWWHQVVSAIAPEKDVDGLVAGSGVVPATARGIMEIFAIARSQVPFPQMAVAVVVGRGEIVGKPVADELEKLGIAVHRFGRKEFAEQNEVLKSADLVVSATGQTHLIQASMLKEGVIVIDAGSPKPEVNPEGLEKVAAFVSPVPGGVGPMTRICLLENLVMLVS